MIKNGDYATGAVWVVIMLLIALGIIIAINLLAGGRSRRQNRW